jgi:pimeloyl-ACP methyl ester carboxylesterase/predicted glycosyltransferase
MRARYPDSDGFVERDGTKLFYEVYGDWEPTILLMPTFPICHSRMWKAQIPYLARSHRLVTFDPRGNGRSDRPRTPEAFADDEFVADTLAVMDETGIDRAVLVALCTGARWSIETAANHPERVQGIVALAPGVPFLSPPHDVRARAAATFDDVVDESEGWSAKENRHYWLRDFPGWVAYHSGEVFMVPEPHSTKLVEDLVSWGLETDAETLLLFHDGPDGSLFPASEEAAVALCERVRCPMLIVHGTLDRCQPIARAERLAEITGGRLVVLEGAGHAPMGRHPVLVNLLIKGFVDSIQPPAPTTHRWTFARNRQPTVLFLSSPIGLGHAQRDAAIAGELRKLRPDVRIDWLTQHPVTKVLEARGERIHPAAAQLANESRHIESEAAEHDIHVFQAIREMDEILVANFMVFHDVVTDEPYDLVIGDESWDVDHFWHENPELKRSPFVWLTDFVGWLPFADGGDREAFLAADYNAEMLEHIERYPRLRDRSIFVGNPDDIVPQDFGPGLPSIREWTESHYDFCGYVTGFDPRELADREGVRAELGYGPDEKVCVVTAGGSGVGQHLLRKVIAAYPAAKRSVPELRMVVVAGPRIDPDSLPSHEGLEVRGYVDHLYRHLGVCDLAVVQGGLTTTMELTAAKRPFLFFPLAHHFEQSFHVAHRLGRYGAGRRMDYATTTPDDIAAAIPSEIGREVSYRDVEADGAARAAALIAEVL